MASFVTNHKSPYASLSDALSKSPLLGKSVLITGAGRGVGQHIARQIAAAGAKRIGIVGRNKVRIVEARDRFEEAFPQTTFEAFTADITDETAVAAVYKSFGVPDVLINNAGYFADDGLFIEQNLKNWWSGFEINILGTAIVTQQLLRAKAEKQAVTVLNVSSLAAHMRMPISGWSGYNGSKMGQARIFEYIRFEHPEVRFINIHPGFIESDGFIKSGASAPLDGMTDGALAGQFFAWAAYADTEFLNGRFVWAEWDIEELQAKKTEIVEKDLLLTTIDGFSQGYF